MFKHSAHKRRDLPDVEDVELDLEMRIEGAVSGSGKSTTKKVNSVDKKLKSSVENSPKDIDSHAITLDLHRKTMDLLQNNTFLMSW